MLTIELSANFLLYMCHQFKTHFADGAKAFDDLPVQKLQTYSSCKFYELLADGAKAFEDLPFQKLQTYSSCEFFELLSVSCSPPSDAPSEARFPLPPVLARAMLPMQKRTAACNF